VVPSLSEAVKPRKRIDEGWSKDHIIAYARVCARYQHELAAYYSLVAIGAVTFVDMQEMGREIEARNPPPPSSHSSRSDMSRLVL
jgi:hypothetical protein